MKLALICSAGGASVFQGYDLAEQNDLTGANNIVLISDRECGAEAAAKSRGIAAMRIGFTDKQQFSSDACTCAQDFGATAVLMTYSRLVGAELYDQIPTLNIHPSLLPAFPGIGAVAAARQAAVHTLGASLHLVDKGIDSGPVLAQAWMAAPPIGTTLENWERASFVLKVYLAALVFEQISSGIAPNNIGQKSGGITNNARSELCNSGMINGFAEFLKARGVENFTP